MYCVYYIVVEHCQNYTIFCQLEWHYPLILLTHLFVASQLLSRIKQTQKMFTLPLDIVKTAVKRENCDQNKIKSCVREANPMEMHKGRGLMMPSSNRTGRIDRRDRYNVISKRIPCGDEAPYRGSIRTCPPSEA